MRIVVCLGFLAGILFSRELWFPINRTFPRAPLLFALPENFAAPVEWLLSGILVAALIFTTVSFRPKIFSIALIASLVLLILFDQTRLQPWVYQYLLLVVLALRDREAKDEPGSTETLGLLQVVIAGLYVWSGVQKLNFTFSHETLPMLLTPVLNVFPSFQPSLLLFLGLAIAVIELLIGCGLLFCRTRNLAVWLAVGMHGAILTLLVAKNFNSIVWVWNAVLIPLVIISFWRSDDSAVRAFAGRKGIEWKSKAAKLIAAASVLLPALSFFGWWDAYLSGALYSGNTAVAVVRIDEDVFEKLPERARQIVFRTKGGGEMILPLFEWAMADLNVPAYPERRVFRQTAREVCKTANNKSRVELIIKERPAVFDGSYKLTRISCAQIDRQL